MNRLEVLKKITKEINSSMGLTHILDMTLDNAIKILNAERGFIMLEGINGVLDIMTARNILTTVIQVSLWQLDPYIS